VLGLGLAAGKGKGAIFRNGEVVRVVDEADYLSALVEEGRKVIAEKASG
jgi:(E)-4-hydroxy-3-methylbut-2-enyl-diphosphate synthase